MFTLGIKQYRKKANNQEAKMTGSDQEIKEEEVTTTKRMLACSTLGILAITEITRDK